MPVTEEIIHRLEAEIPEYNHHPLTLHHLEDLAGKEGFDLVVRPLAVDGLNVPGGSGHGRVILVNQRLMPGHRDFVGWHEYFHKLHPGELAFYRRARYFDSKIELQASILAAVAVMPTPVLMEIGQEARFLDPTVLRGHFEIPNHLARFRLKVLDGYQNLLRARQGWL
ncbi:MAG: ImmA/IrrE family metallo-endopeptidase [Proteobacteria bacterium]|nr:ImmA/IrrE family metallo-endopeptidase [Pseudomonadota bacterium]